MQEDNWEPEWKQREWLYIEALKAQKRYLEAYNCEVCGKAGHATSLEGGRCVVLCMEHTDEIHNDITSLEVWLRWLDAQAMYDVAIRSGSAVSANRVKNDVLQELYALTGQWMEEKRSGL